MSFKRDICCFDFRSNFLVSIFFLINIGKEVSLPGFRKYVFLSFLSNIYIYLYFFATHENTAFVVHSVK